MIRVSDHEIQLELEKDHLKLILCLKIKLYDTVTSAVKLGLVLMEEQLSHYKIAKSF